MEYINSKLIDNISTGWTEQSVFCWRSCPQAHLFMSGSRRRSNI